MIKELVFDNASYLASVHDSIFDFHWNEDHYKMMFLNPNYIIKGLYLSNILIGYYVISNIDVIEIQAITIFKEYQGLKYGSLLLNDIIVYARSYHKRVLLEVSFLNEKATNLYLNSNFKIINTRKDYYKKGDHAYLMEYQGE